MTNAPGTPDPATTAILNLAGQLVTSLLGTANQLGARVPDLIAQATGQPDATNLCTGTDVIDVRVEHLDAVYAYRLELLAEYPDADNRAPRADYALDIIEQIRTGGVSKYCRCVMRRELQVPADPERFVKAFNAAFDDVRTRLYGAAEQA